MQHKLFFKHIFIFYIFIYLFVYFTVIYTVQSLKNFFLDHTEVIILSSFKNLPSGLVGVVVGVVVGVGVEVGVGVGVVVPTMWEVQV